MLTQDVDIVNGMVRRRTEDAGRVVHTFSYKGYSVDILHWPADPPNLARGWEAKKGGEKESGMEMNQADAISAAKEYIDSKTKDAFSPEARKAALEARRKKAQSGGAHSGKSKSSGYREMEASNKIVTSHPEYKKRLEERYDVLGPATNKMDPARVAYNKHPNPKTKAAYEEAKAEFEKATKESEAKWWAFVDPVQKKAAEQWMSGRKKANEFLEARSRKKE